MSFDMPSGVGVTFEKRGGWVVNALAKQYGLTLNQAAGIVGNLGFESMGFKTLQEIKPMISGSRGGYGWAQWTGLRRRNFEAWCRARSLKPSSDEANYGFLCQEMDGTHAYCMGPLRREVAIEQCVFVWGRDYEAPAGTTHDHLPAFDDRLKYARRALAGAAGAAGSAQPARTPSHRTGDPDNSANDLNRAEADANDPPR